MQVVLTRSLEGLLRRFNSRKRMGMNKTEIIYVELLIKSEDFLFLHHESYKNKKCHFKIKMQEVFPENLLLNNL